MHASIKERGIIQKKCDAWMSDKRTLHDKNQMNKNIPCLHKRKTTSMSQINSASIARH